MCRIWHAQLMHQLSFIVHIISLSPCLILLVVMNLMTTTSPNTSSVPLRATISCNILQPQLPYDLHDAQLEGICKAIDDMDLMVLTPTGSRKNGYFTMYMLLMLSLATKPELIQPLKKKVPPNPVMVLIFPTNGVEEEQSANKKKNWNIGSIEDMGFVP